MGLSGSGVPWRVWPGRILGAVWFAAAVLQMAGGVLEIFHLRLFDQPVTPETVFVLFETNPREVLEFFQMYLGAQAGEAAGLVLAPLVVLGLAELALSRLPGSWLQRGPRLAWGGLACLVLVNLPFHRECWRAHRDGLALVHLLSAVEEYRAQTEIYYALKASLGEAPPVGPPPRETSPDELYVLVLGESTGRNHMGLYGYPRPTTPRLAALGDSLLVYRDVVSPHSHTQAVLKKMLTFHNREASGPWNRSGTLLRTLGSAGYRTYWFSNQNVYGVWSNVTAALAAQADVKLFHKNRKAGLIRRAHDGDLLPYLDRLLETPTGAGRFLVLHLMGTHGWYPNRFPESFARFRDPPPGSESRSLHPVQQQTINHYDNAVLYNDWLVAEVIERVRRFGGRSWVLYLSDHGEDVYDAGNFLGHTEEVGNRFMVEIPFLLWFSPGFREARPELVRRAAEATGRPYMTDDLPHTVLDLLDLEDPRFEPGRSLVHAEFQEKRSRIYRDQDYDRVWRVAHPAGVH